MTADDDLRRAANAALTDFIYEHGSDFDEAQWPGFAALRAALAARSEPRAHEPLSGLDALRHGIEAEPRAEGLRQALLNHAYGAHGMTEAEADHWVSSLVAATPPAEGLDVRNE